MGPARHLQQNNCSTLVNYVSAAGVQGRSSSGNMPNFHRYINPIREAKDTFRMSNVTSIWEHNVEDRGNCLRPSGEKRCNKNLFCIPSAVVLHVKIPVILLKRRHSLASSSVNTKSVYCPMLINLPLPHGKCKQPQQDLPKESLSSDSLALRPPDGPSLSTLVAEDKGHILLEVLGPPLPPVSLRTTTADASCKAPPPGRKPNSTKIEH
ncbi:uncharacterized protein [Macaca nemestrina]|uniref:uncharacterized protein n=1 Tax=Macaca nemestrina TaxID=9545 RepID=UPI0039B85E68